MSGLIAFDAPAYYVTEGELFAAPALVRTGDFSGPATLTYTLVPGTATEGADYPGPTTGTITFGKNVRRVVLPLPIADDTTVEPDEQFTVVLSAADAGTTIGAQSQASITIADDDARRANPGPDALIPPYRVTVEPVGAGFRVPVTMAFIPGTNLALVAEKTGNIKLLDISGTARSPTLIDLRERVNSSGERGLLGIALHPDFAHHPYIYAYYSVDPAGAAGRTGNAARDAKGNRFSHLSRFTLDMSGKLPKIDPASEVVLLGKGAELFSDIGGGGNDDYTEEKFATERATNVAPDGRYKRDVIKVDSQTHVGGAVAFGPDGMLYVSTGDGSSFTFADARAANAQDPDSLNGKILRLDPLTGEGLADNPYADGDLGDNRSKVWATGLRNPYTMTFTADGRLFASDTGWDSWEEINVITRAGNYGWPFFEGGDNGVLLHAPEHDTDPVAQQFYADVAAGKINVTAPWRAFAHDDKQPGFQFGAIVGSTGIYTSGHYPPALDNSYFFTDIVDGEIYAANIDDPAHVHYITDLGSFGPTSFAFGPDGYMYLLDMVDDRVLRLRLTDDLGK